MTLDHKASKDLKVIQDRRVYKVSLEILDHKVSRDLLDLLDHKDVQAIQDPLVHKACRVYKVSLEQLDHKVYKDPVDPRAPQARKDLLVPLVPQVMVFGQIPPSLVSLK